MAWPIERFLRPYLLYFLTPIRRRSPVYFRYSDARWTAAAQARERAVVTGRPDGTVAAFLALCSAFRYVSEAFPWPCAQLE